MIPRTRGTVRDCLKKGVVVAAHHSSMIVSNSSPILELDGKLSACRDEPTVRHSATAVGLPRPR